MNQEASHNEEEMPSPNRINYTILQGDNRETLKTIPDNSIDTIVTSPPYNLKGFRASRGAHNLPISTIWSGSLIDYDGFDDNMDEYEYQTWQKEFINECWRVLKPTGSLFYQHKIRRWAANSSHPMSWINDTRAKFYQEIIWDRGGTIAKDPHYLLPTTESIYWLTKERPIVFRKRLPEEYRKVIWPIKLERNPDHPAPFPTLLARLCVLLTTPEGGTVLDPFSGSGTTGCAAVELGFKFIGCELNPKYIEIARARIEATQITNNTFRDLFQEERNER